ncbi:MAG TPA: UBP-type zinc finger domain-containing protein [Thermoplasmata archaeon]|nr:UBP-type zinc finger domain-containing protein [Thermoplasmata archaeon]
MTDGCEHLAKAGKAKPKRTDACEKCIEEKTRWVNLRFCATCGNVGCCDSSPRRHARKHWEGSEHPVIGPVTGEGWLYCFPDNATK